MAQSLKLNKKRQQIEPPRLLSGLSAAHAMQIECTFGEMGVCLDETPHTSLSAPAAERAACSFLSFLSTSGTVGNLVGRRSLLLHVPSNQYGQQHAPASPCLHTAATTFHRMLQENCKIYNNKSADDESHLMLVGRSGGLLCVCCPHVLALVSAQAIIRLAAVGE